MADLKYFDEVLKYINELSTTIDLPSTRVRAEVLFYKFQRTVEAADRNEKFPNPSAGVLKRRRMTGGGGDAGEGSSSAGGTSGAAVVGKGKEVEGKGNGPVVSEELRKLLSREVIRAK